MLNTCSTPAQHFPVLQPPCYDTSKLQPTYYKCSQPSNFTTQPTRFHNAFTTLSKQCHHDVATMSPRFHPTPELTTRPRRVSPPCHKQYHHARTTLSHTFITFTRHSVTTMHTQSTHKHHTCIILESHFHDTYIALSPRANSHPECANCRHTFTHIHKTFTTLSPNCHRTFTTLTKPHFQHLQTSTAASQSSRSFHHAFSARSPHCHRTSATLPPQFHHTVTTHSPYCHCTSKLPPSYHTLSPHHHRASTHPD